MTKLQHIRTAFPMLQQDLVYLDSAALVQKPQVVIDAINDFYTKYAVSNRTSDSILGIKTDQVIMAARLKVAQLLGVNWTEVFFNSGATEGLNYSAQLLGPLLQPGDQILISVYNHSSHIIPWVEMAAAQQAIVVFSQDLLRDLTPQTKIVCYTQANNTFANNVDPAALRAAAPQAWIVNDAAQAISHEVVCGATADIIAFSANKFFGPTGLGVLYIATSLLRQVRPKKYGGGAVATIGPTGQWTPNTNYFQQHEPGTLNLAALYGFNQALDFFNQFKIDQIQSHLTKLAHYAYDKLARLPNVTIESHRGDPIILFDVSNSSAQEVSSYLGHHNIYVRSGWFCAKYLENLRARPLIRVSLHIYNTRDDIDKLCHAIKNGGDFLGFI